MKNVRVLMSDEVHKRLQARAAKLGLPTVESLLLWEAELPAPWYVASFMDAMLNFGRLAAGTKFSAKDFYGEAQWNDLKLRDRIVLGQVLAEAVDNGMLYDAVKTVNYYVKL